MSETRTKKKTCYAGDILGETLVALVKLNPTEPQVRALVMAKCQKAVPDKLTTGEKILDWVESLEYPGRESEDDFTDSVLEADCRVNRTDFGTCSYNCTESGRSRIRISRENLRNAVINSVNWHGLFSNLSGLIDDGVWENAEWGETSDYEYDDHHANDTDNETWEYANVENFRQRVRNAVAEQWPADFARFQNH